MNFALKSYGTFKMFLLSAQNNLYIILSPYVEGYLKKIQVWISCLRLVSRPPKPGCFFEKFTAEKVFKSFSGRNNSWEPPGFGCSNSFSFCKNRESWEPWLVGFWVKRHSKIQNFYQQFFKGFWSCHYRFTNSFY